MRKWVIILGLLSLLPVMSACNTLHGAGEDVTQTGQSVERATK